ncbi:glycosyltransferase family 2 protein [Cellulomonas sp. Leaf395]|uniref:glycosyltransferase family 2 protein n=1 Tax=Cellulomonas sp. Leaf395 TaxID=1736362 RepID=UPI0006FD8474|nr:glycosyltransferase family 2 protein [Cellulomonas sp. Leaf395]KQS99779.1 glycosyl transferase [Cellulomonas sp. Leaf395]
MPLDILVPFWGDPQLLQDAIRSVQAQTSTDWVVTVVDDAYPDASVAEFFASLGDARVRYVRNETNLGITDNYRRCLELAEHDLLVFLGCDDLLLPDFVEVVLAAHAAHPDAAVIQPGVQVIDENGHVVRTLVDVVKQRVTMPRGQGRRRVGGEALAASLLRADWMYWPSLVFRREVVARIGFRDGLPLIQDLAIVVDIITEGGSMVIEPTVCFSYRRHSASASSATLLDGKRFRGEREYFRRAAAQMDARGWSKAARAARLHLTSRLHAVTLVPQAVLSRDADGARQLLGHAFARAA